MRPPTALQAFIEEAIEPGSLLHTDGWAAHHPVTTHGYRHQVTVLPGAADLAVPALPHVHRVVSLLRRWLLGTIGGEYSERSERPLRTR